MREEVLQVEPTELLWSETFVRMYTNVQKCDSFWSSVLSRLFWGVLHPPLVQLYPPISVSEAAAPP